MTTFSRAHGFEELILDGLERIRATA